MKGGRKRHDDTPRGEARKRETTKRSKDTKARSGAARRGNEGNRRECRFLSPLRTLRVLRGLNSCETKPIRRVARCLGGQLYKQSQFGVFSSHKGCHCEQTNPICTRREESVGQAPPYRWLNCAKQSQFRRRRQEGQRLGRKGVMVNMTSDGPRQNKANSAGRDAPGRTARGLLLGHDAPNKPNFRLRRADETWGTGPRAIVRHRLDAPLRETKPIRNKSGEDAQPTKSDCAKQSQFADRGLGTDQQRDALHGPADRSQLHKQTQFPAAPGGTGPGGRGLWDVVQTKPISDGVASVKFQV